MTSRWCACVRAGRRCRYRLLVRRRCGTASRRWCGTARSPSRSGRAAAECGPEGRRRGLRPRRRHLGVRTALRRSRHDGADARGPGGDRADLRARQSRPACAAGLRPVFHDPLPALRAVPFEDLALGRAPPRSPCDARPVRSCWHDGAPAVSALSRRLRRTHQHVGECVGRHARVPTSRPCLMRDTRRRRMRSWTYSVAMAGLLAALNADCTDTSRRAPGHHRVVDRDSSGRAATIALQRQPRATGEG